MTIQPPDGPPTAPLGQPDGSAGPHADWSSPLWGHPDTLAASWAPAPSQPAPDVVPPPSASHPLRTVLVGAGVLLLLLTLVAGALVRGGFGDARATASTLPAPGAAAPAAPSVGPTHPQPPRQPGSGQSRAAEQRASVAAVGPGLVDIVSTIGYDGNQGAGTGVVLTSDGLVLTNHHVVAGSTALKVTDVGNGRTYAATVVGYDTSHDVAVIKLAGASGLRTAPLGDSSTVRVGDEVVALGNALGKGGPPTAAAGEVTALDQSISALDSSNGTSEQLSGLIQVDANVQPGDSGGALIDANHQVVGIVTAASVVNGRPHVAAQGYAVPLATAIPIADQIVAGRSSQTVHIGGTAFLGVQLAAGSASDRGVVVVGVVRGSPADRAGISGGDVITHIDGTRVRSGSALKAALAGHRPGDTVTVGWVDLGGTSHHATVALMTGPTG